MTQKLFKGGNYSRKYDIWKLSPFFNQWSNLNLVMYVYSGNLILDGLWPKSDDGLVFPPENPLAFKGHYSALFPVVTTILLCCGEWLVRRGFAISFLTTFAKKKRKKYIFANSARIYSLLGWASKCNFVPLLHSPVGNFLKCHFFPKNSFHISVEGS